MSGGACDDPCVNGTETPPNSGNCVCDEGFAGVGCDSECSGNGVIVAGSCVCHYSEGWKGRLCDIPGCPGLFNLDCSGRGQLTIDKQKLPVTVKFDVSSLYIGCGL